MFELPEIEAIEAKFDVAKLDGTAVRSVDVHLTPTSDIENVEVVAGVLRNVSANQPTLETDDFLMTFGR